MDLSPTLLEGIILFTIGGVCFWLWYLKGKTEDVRDELHKEISLVKESVHDLEKKLIAEYASKNDMKEVVRESLAPLREAIGELKGDLRTTINAINSLKLYGPPE
jgi:hypothetical protein